MSEYRNGIEDALAALKVNLVEPVSPMQKDRAMEAGRRLAKKQKVPADYLKDDVIAQLGPAWSEFGSRFPKNVGMALISVGFSPLSDEANRLFMKGFLNELKSSKDDPADHIRFVEDYASPHSWYRVMEALHEQAELIYGKWPQQGIESHYVFDNGVQKHKKTIAIAHKAVFLLAGFALENALKGFLVYENPSWVSNGRLCKKLGSHDLRHLRDQSNIVPFRKSYNRTLHLFSDGITSWSRYPCAMSLEETRGELTLSLPDWLSYLRLIKSYEKRLRELIESGWNGPHGYVLRKGELSFQGVDVGHHKVPDMFEAYTALDRVWHQAEMALRRPSED